MLDLDLVHLKLQIRNLLLQFGASGLDLLDTRLLDRRGEAPLPRFGDERTEATRFAACLPALLRQGLMPDLQRLVPRRWRVCADRHNGLGNLCSLLALSHGERGDATFQDGDQQQHFLHSHSFELAASVLPAVTCWRHSRIFKRGTELAELARVQGGSAQIWEELSPLEKLELAERLEREAQLLEKAAVTLKVSVFSSLSGSKFVAWLRLLDLDDSQRN